MRVLLFRLLCDTGGVSTSMQLLGEQLHAQGEHTEYWFCRPSNRLPEFKATGRATLAPLSRLAPRLERGEFDVVHMTATDPAAPLVARMAAGQARVVVTARGALSDLWNHRNCFAYTAISHGMAQINQPYTDLEIEVVRNAIDTARFTPPEETHLGRPIVAFVGRTTSAEKDFPRFTRIAGRRVVGGARGWLADPPEGGWDRFPDAPLERVPTERWGRVSHGEMADFYRAVAASGGVVLMTSRSEGFGNVAPEAAACGARVAAPDVIGLREAIVDGETGRLFPATASDDEVAELVQGWLDSPHDKNACSAAAREAFSPELLTARYREIYGRREQRLLRTRTEPVATAELPILLEHLGRQPAWRASFTRGAAADLASAGYRRLALDALRMTLETSSDPFLSSRTLRDVVSVGRRLVARRQAST
jgi:glycosyltransferase involved in cell wall biosynthesis